MDLVPAEARSVDAVGRVELVADYPRCPECDRTSLQHGRLSCEDIDHIAARVAFYALPWWRRVGRRPQVRRRGTLPRRMINMPSSAPSPTRGEVVA